MTDLKLTFACWNYDRTKALADGGVKPEGIALNYINLFPGETFQRMVRYKEFDVAELGFKNYLNLIDAGDPPFVAIPVYPVRLFLHSAIFINKQSGIATPEDLIGKRVGELFSYGHDAAIWARGILSDEYGVPHNSVTYHVGPIEPAIRRDWRQFAPPKDVRVETIGPTQGLDAMLEAGEIDALYSAITPPSVLNGSPKVGRLFENYEAVERDYYKRTGVFPIVHLVVIRRELYEQHRWVAQSLYKAFKAAKDEAQKLYEQQAGAMHRLFMTPWLTAHQEENRKLMGDDFWPYGLEPNRKALELFLRYHHEQGLSKRLITVDELFAPETLVDYARFG
jgi:4,5-dihydroxyphthalate decarboxylase